MNNSNARQRLLFVTNLAHEDRSEDLFLADRLANEWDVTIAAANDAAKIAEAGGYWIALIRNAWPSFEFDPAFSVLELLVREGKLKTYNPPSTSRGFHENKAYLLDLYMAGYPVIPTFESVAALTAAQPAWAENALYKPLNSCSSIGLMAGPAEELPDSKGIYQPWVDFEHEVSLFFIDNQFAYAVRSASHSKRWNLQEFQPSAEDLAWAQKFVDWNALPYGIQRIDGGRTKSGRLLLTEVEDFLPCLTLDVLAPERRDDIVDRLLASVRWHLLNPN